MESAAAAQKQSATAGQGRRFVGGGQQGDGGATEAGKSGSNKSNQVRAERKCHFDIKHM